MVAHWKIGEITVKSHIVSKVTIWLYCECTSVRSSMKQSHARLTLFIWDQNATKIRKISQTV